MMTSKRQLDRVEAAGLKSLQICGRGRLPFGSQITNAHQLLERMLPPGVADGTPA